MRLCIFSGPTLPVAEGLQHVEARFLPPAAQGDVYRAALERPVAIGLVDGYFDRVAAVSHKEILWAMAQGIHVLGAASMGALRAAELALFGMEGVGAIFDAYARGDLEADDEVAIAHASGEDGYRPVSEALVNMRATLAAAEDAGVISAPTRSRLSALAQASFYPDRSYPRLLQSGADDGLPPPELTALRAFLPRGRVNQKHRDALDLVRLMAERFAGEVQPKQVRYHFEPTDAWAVIRERADARAAKEPDR
jgi:hypothetical protein